MELPPELVVIHQPVRLRIMGLLYKQRDVAFTAARDALGLSDGNLASHANRLSDAGYLDARRVLTRDGFESRFRITRAGLDAFRAYLEVLQQFLAGMPPKPTAAPKPPDPGTESPPKQGAAAGAT